MRWKPGKDRWADLPPVLVKGHDLGLQLLGEQTKKTGHSLVSVTRCLTIFFHPATWSDRATLYINDVWKGLPCEKGAGRVAAPTMPSGMFLPRLKKPLKMHKTMSYSKKTDPLPTDLTAPELHREKSKGISVKVPPPRAQATSRACQLCPVPEHQGTEGHRGCRQ